MKSDVEQKIALVKSALEGEDNTLLESSLSELQESVQKVGQAVYSKTGAAPGADQDVQDVDPQNSGSDDPDNTVEGEFREV